MKRVIAIMNDGATINIEADKLETQDNFFMVKKAGELVAAIDSASTICIYLSERKANE